MTNRSKNIGTALESACVKYLKTRGYRGALRPALHGMDDVGDVWTSSPTNLAIECKAGAAAERASRGQVAEWVQEAMREAIAADASAWLLVKKRKGTGLANIQDQDAWLEVDIKGLPYVVQTTFEQALDMLEAMGVLK